MATTTACPLRCPAGWRTVSGAGDHCYWWPPKPIEKMNFWNYQNYCQSMQPTSYIVSVNNQAEYQNGAMQAMAYMLTYVVGTFYVWLGAYWQNGGWHWLDNSTWSYNNMYIDQVLGGVVTDPPADGDCVFVDPKTTAGSWHFRPCTDPDGATICEMEKLPDCSGTTPMPETTTLYMPPTCTQARWADFVQQQDPGYSGMTAMLILEGMDTDSCAVACLYYDGCWSFDIELTAGTCRLVGRSVLMSCEAVVPLGDYVHYDMTTLPTWQ